MGETKNRWAKLRKGQNYWKVKNRANFSKILPVIEILLQLMGSLVSIHKPVLFVADHVWNMFILRYKIYSYSSLGQEGTIIEFLGRRKGKQISRVGGNATYCNVALQIIAFGKNRLISLWVGICVHWSPRWS